MKIFNSCKTISCFLSENNPSLPFLKYERTNVVCNILKIRIKRRLQMGDSLELGDIWGSFVP